jgi:hypothetical protein
MFGSKKIKEMQKDPKKAIEEADKTLNKGITGKLSKMFMGKETVAQFNEGLEQAKKFTGQSDLHTTGVPAKATVMKIEDTGMLVNYNPVVRMQLKVQPDFGIGFETTAEVAVSKIAVPRVGDTISIKYDPANNSNIVVV